MRSCADATLRTAAGALALLLAGGTAATARTTARTMRVQWVFKHFDGARVRLSVDGSNAFDRILRVFPDNARNGVASTAFIEMAVCSEVKVVADTRRLAQRLCLAPGTKSVVVEGREHLSLAQVDSYWGAD